MRKWELKHVNLYSQVSQFK